MRVVGVSGHAQHGKDTIAAMIAEVETRRKVVRIGFADALKRECLEEHGWNGEKDAAGRALLQRVGVERRAADVDYWVRKAFEQIVDPETLYVIPDVRFPNEADAIRRLGGELWRVERVDPDTGALFDNGLSPAAKTHESETALDRYPFDRRLYNITLRGLRAQVEMALGL